MAEIITIEAQSRDLTGRKTNQLRADSIVPVVMYGFKTDPISLQISRGDFVRAYNKAGESTVVELSVDGVKHPVLIQGVQYDALTDDVIHVDFRRINMDEKIETAISIKLIGVSPAVKDLGGTLVHSLEEVQVLALPAALVREFILDVSVLAKFDDVLRVSDIQAPAGIEILTDMQDTIALIQEPVSEDELKAQEEEAKESIEGVAKKEEELAKAKEAEKTKE
ncbi:50S ribosomal protein L25 [Candidatus Parcubacteria bacterium]|nr:50S ribosomal protein L25 [Candidatus Parcubacteria bacterium]